MPRLYLLLIFFIWSRFSNAQPAYFQQHVDYSIDVTLDDKQHMLHGFEKIVYTNHSKDTLHFIYFHLWPNAYKNDRNEYTKQSVENGQTQFYYSRSDQRGFIDSLLFKVNDEVVNISNYNNHEDIIVIELSEPLLPEKSILISTPFNVKIPYTFSRLGHVNQSYQISQWYPKPAVYDREGWHPLPYLDQGEFYSEYGDFNVHITLPANYIVAATGDLQEETEKQFIDNRNKASDTLYKTIDSVIASSVESKTISFKQQNVHDFAWFADKRFLIEKTIATLPSGNKVDCYSYYKAEEKNSYNGSSTTIAQTISYLSQHVGEYPYHHASIVGGSIITGDGMEYPNVAVIGPTNSKSMLETVIIHEVGHNWFYGLLGSNERDHPWMDESINSFYEKEIKKYIQKDTNTSQLEQRVTSFNDKLNGVFLYQLSTRNNTDQSSMLPATEYTYFNYGSIIYQKTPMLLAYLKSYLGDSIFEKAMKRYYAEWHFKHPAPDDFKNILCKESGHDLHWFFDEGLNSTAKIDFKIQSVSSNENTTLVMANSRTSFKGPIPVSACTGNTVIQTKWIEYPYKDAAIFTNLPAGITSYKIDPKGIIPEVKISNNNYIIGTLFHHFHPALKVGSSLGISNKQKLYLLPAIAYNHYDQFMLGGVIHNLEIPNHIVQFALAPLYSFGTKSLTGSGFISYSILPKKVANEITLTIQGNTFHDNESNLNIDHSIYTRHCKFMPSVTIDFKNRVARSPASNQLAFRYYVIMNQFFNYTKTSTDTLYKASLSSYYNTQYASIQFTHKNKRTFNPFAYLLNVTGNNGSIKATIEGNLKIDYAQKGNAFYLRLFGGKFIDFKTNSNSFSLQNLSLHSTSTGYTDYLYDQVYIARNEQKGFLSQQIALQEGAFKIKTPFLSNPVGQNNNWLTAINLRTDLPIKLPIKVQLFFDAATFADASKLNSSGKKAIYDAGIEFHFFNELLNVYAPLLMSKDFSDYTKTTYTKNRFLHTISFSLNLDRINWFKTQQAIDLFN